ncbi:MAG: diguanylate cyclase, partial [Armatimonadetes bacterium]|nr:diguanylate cyclase [Armatimonadota bacterium]
GRPADALQGRPLAAFAPDAGKGDSELVSRLRDALRDQITNSFPLSFADTEQNYQVFVTPRPDGVFVCLQNQTGQVVEAVEAQEGRRLVEQMIELAPEIVYLQDIHANENVYINRDSDWRFAPIGEDATSALVPEDAARQTESRARFATGESVIEYDYRRTAEDGAVRWFRARETVFGRDHSGATRLVLGFAQEVTQQRDLMERYRNRAEYLRRLTESTPDCILTLDLKGGLLQINRSGKALMEIGDFAPLIGAEWTLLFQESYRPVARRALQTALKGGTERFQGVAKTAIGTPIWWDVVVTPIVGSDGTVSQIVTVARDISGFKALEAEREQLLKEAITRADYDPLTGLLNHRAFHRKLQEADPGGNTSAQPMAILRLDLDNFRYFNEAFGRATGDELLTRLAKEIAVCCRTTDTLARIGPDEFGIIAPQMHRDEIVPYILRLRAAVDGIGMRSPGGDTIPLHIAVGYALFPEETANASAAYDVAEERQRADQTGGNSHEAERVRESLRETVVSFGMLDTLIATIDAKDRMTRRQSEDTLIYSRRIAENFGLTPEQKRSLDIAALLHDVGKVGIDERILRQPGKLSDDDFAVVQQHPKIGAMLVGSTVDDVDTVEAVLYHHENWNGTGYPAGLVGEEIPLLARILNVASSYAAMTNHRPYRKGMTPNAAQKVLQNGAGTQWDAHCVAALIEAAK